jgi:hypothetical protein
MVMASLRLKCHPKKYAGFAVYRVRNANSDAEGVLPLPEATGMADATSMAYTYAVCAHTDDAVGYVIPGCVGFCPEGAAREP